VLCAPTVTCLTLVVSVYSVRDMVRLVNKDRKENYHESVNQESIMAESHYHLPLSVQPCYESTKLTNHMFSRLVAEQRSAYSKSRSSHISSTNKKMAFPW
jgi:hypothetical protein